METEDASQRANRLSFVVAIMTKDYSRAIDMGTSILNRDPDDHHVRKCLSALKKIRKSNKSAAERESDLSERETDLSTSGSEESDIADSGSDDTDNDACEKITESAVDSENVCQARISKSVVDCVRETASNNTAGENKKFFDFREKMYRALPLKFARKK